MLGRPMINTCLRARPGLLSSGRTITHPSTSNFWRTTTYRQHKHPLLLRQTQTQSHAQGTHRPTTTTTTATTHPLIRHVVRAFGLAARPSSLRRYSTVVVHSAPRTRLRRTLSFLLIATTSFLAGGYLSLTYAPPILAPLIMGSLPTDLETLAYEAPDDYTREIDEHLRTCELATRLRADPRFTESRPHLKIPDAVRQHNLTAGTLAGPGKLPVPPLYFHEEGGKSMACLFYVGADLSGHPGIVHGGFLATMLDEGLARCAFAAMPNKVGVTANLNINYRRPTMAGQFLVLRATTTKTEGRKAYSEGWIEPLDEVGEDGAPIKLVEASALFIEPKHANVLKSLYKVAT